jgi:hypothetical protein
MNGSLQTQTGAGVTLFAAAGGIISQEGIQHFTPTLMALGAFLGGVASLLPALTSFLNARQLRAHAERLHLAELLRLEKSR